ncbi:MULTISPECIES: hypothetical protein [unclassified Agarivorans]|uniref:hypothetical protein n=1 Tax=unclassified Agarivorans TaxID=2636026 RepID=UPI0026E1462B|nr:MULTISPECIES: hypothetical protein [unclassified Agarivorans]MDO6687133.1 hypothetical protein [Agarivorans sp. 3_MG-2023]MDO6716940.1 hypothetical protein [Agarivorans sp. 2_MG-2023]
MLLANLRSKTLCLLGLLSIVSSVQAEPLPTRDHAAQALAASYNLQSPSFEDKALASHASAQGDVVHYQLTLPNTASNQQVQQLAAQLNNDICKYDQDALYRGVRVKLSINSGDGSLLYQSIQSDNNCSRLPY